MPSLKKNMLYNIFTGLIKFKKRITNPFSPLLFQASNQSINTLDLTPETFKCINSIKYVYHINITIFAYGKAKKELLNKSSIFELFSFYYVHNLMMKYLYILSNTHKCIIY